MYLGSPFYGYALNGHFVYLTTPGTGMSVMYEKENLFVLFICKRKKSISHLFK